MKVFISFSGEKSKRAAKVLNEWLPDVIQAVAPFLSDEIAKGARPAQEIWGSLVDAEYGILCLTRENLQRPWINYEAGALAHKLAPERSSDASTDIPVTGFLVDVESPTEVKGPLGYFQHTRFSEAEFGKLVRSINQRLPDESRLSESRLERAFDMHWEAFRDKIQEINDDESLQAGEEQSQRTERDLLEEILELVRAQSRRDRRVETSDLSHSGQLRTWYQSLHQHPPDMSDEERLFREIQELRSWRNKPRGEEDTE